MHLFTPNNTISPVFASVILHVIKPISGTKKTISATFPFTEFSIHILFESGISSCRALLQLVVAWSMMRSFKFISPYFEGNTYVCQIEVY